MSYLAPVSVIRYVRPMFTDSKLANLGGVTFVFTMDYNIRTVSVQFAICSPKDNFDKKAGIAHARSTPVRVFNLDKFQAYADQTGGFVSAYLHIASSDDVTGTLSVNERNLLKKMALQQLIV
jgi:hypothetical protein